VPLSSTRDRPAVNRLSSLINHSLSIKYLPASRLKPDPKNPRLHSEKQVRQIARSIEVFGFNVPLLVNAEMQVVAGHGRLQACHLLGITEGPDHWP
jgi:ParB-like chromosome segregation protein Spo0J